jgi:hypothetical protein
VPEVLTPLVLSANAALTIITGNKKADVGSIIFINDLIQIDWPMDCLAVHHST